MSFDRKNIRSAPLKRTGEAPAVKAVSSSLPSELIVKGQGVVEADLKGTTRDLLITLTAPDEPGYALTLTVSKDKATITASQGGKVIERWEQMGAGAALDQEPACRYWLSLDPHNRAIRYGKGENRLDTQKLLATYPAPANPEQDPWGWVSHLSAIGYENAKDAAVWRDPVVTSPPLAVVRSDDVTMDQAARYEVAVAANLSVECQKLYQNICGASFTLNTPDFPDFTDAIEASIVNPEGWCYKKLQEKANEFGEPNYDATYLRITLGQNQGESPGVPYVLEIWPPGHYSPIHNHAGAHAVIRVLHGAITVNLYSMLSTVHQTPFTQRTFYEGQITWITPGLNQTHKLQNKGVSTCMTIQCYLYSLADRAHYEYFDYIDNSGKGIGHFDPSSDMDFLAFKALMKEEYHARQKKG